MAENELVRQHHIHNGHEFEQTLGGSEGQGTIHRVTESPTRLSN